MRTKVIAFAMAASLALSPTLYACSGSNDASSSQNASQSSQAEKPAAPALDGKWRQVGHAEGDDGMIGTIDQDMIALWIRGNGKEYNYWCGTFEAPKTDGAYKWTSKADKGNMTGLFASQDDTKDFSYADGKISFQFSMRGETTTIEMEQASEETGLLAELRAGEGKSVSKEKSNIKDLVLSDSCYTVNNGYVHYTIAVNNPNKEYAPQSVNVSVVGRTSDGKISFSDNWGTSTCLPESTTYWSNQAGNGNVSESDTIDIKLSVDDDKWFKTSQKYDFYAIDNVSTADEKFGGTIATGEITLKNNVTLKGFGKADSPSLVCVLKDAGGKLVDGFSTYITKQLKVGEATPFEIRSMSQSKVDFATAEVYANPW